MPNRFRFGLALASVLLASVATLVMSQQNPAPFQAGTAFVEPTGAEMFHAYCASCHGQDARGHGPAAQALKVAPPDLTLLAKQNQGKFPAGYVNSVITHGINTPAHGSAEMPVWGPVFVGIKDRQTVILHADRLSNYIETLQAK